MLALLKFKIFPIQTTEDLEKVDKQRRTDFKTYEMEKEFERQQELNAMDEEHRKQAEAKYNEEIKHHAQHPKLHHPGSKQQLEEVNYWLMKVETYKIR